MRFDGEIRIEDEKENDVKNNDEAKRFKCSGVVEIRKCTYGSKSTSLRWYEIDMRALLSLPFVFFSLALFGL